MCQPQFAEEVSGVSGHSSCEVWATSICVCVCVFLQHQGHWSEEEEQTLLSWLSEWQNALSFLFVSIPETSKKAAVGSSSGIAREINCRQSENEKISHNLVVVCTFESEASAFIFVPFYMWWDAALCLPLSMWNSHAPPVLMEKIHIVNTMPFEKSFILVQSTCKHAGSCIFQNMFHEAK